MNEFSNIFGHMQRQKPFSSNVIYVIFSDAPAPSGFPMGSCLRDHSRNYVQEMTDHDDYYDETDEGYLEIKEWNFGNNRLTEPYFM